MILQLFVKVQECPMHGELTLYNVLQSEINNIRTVCNNVKEEKKRERHRECQEH